MPEWVFDEILAGGRLGGECFEEFLRVLDAVNFAVTCLCEILQQWQVRGQVDEFFVVGWGDFERAA